MVVRTYDAQSMVVLPNMDAQEGATLAQEVNTAAKAEKKLPPRIAKALEILMVAYQALLEVLRQGLGPAIDQGSDAAPDRVLKSSWAALGAWLDGWQKIPSADSQVTIARRLYTALFPSGLAFIRLTHKQLWTESEKRLEHIKKEPLDKGKKETFEDAILKLGGGFHLTTVRDAHTAYGIALGITAPAKPAPEPPDVRDKFDALKAAFRLYIMQAAGVAFPDEPGTTEQAQRLVKPFAEWQSRPRTPPAPKQQPLKNPLEID